MIIKDELNFFYLESNVSKKMVIEKNYGFWKQADIDRLKEGYTKLSKDLNSMGNWCKLCDLSKYKTSSISDQITEFMFWCAEHGLTHVGIILSKDEKNLPKLVKMQMNRTCKPVTVNYFYDEYDAINWLREMGYTNV